MAAKLAPHDPAVQAALNVVGGAPPAPSKVDWQQVAAGHRKRLEDNPQDLTPLHDLVALHRSGSRPDHTLAAATLLVHFGAATEDEQRKQGDGN